MPFCSDHNLVNIQITMQFLLQMTQETFTSVVCCYFVAVVVVVVVTNIVVVSFHICYCLSTAYRARLPGRKIAAAAVTNLLTRDM